MENDIWRKKNSYYYDYLESFVRFLVPEGKRSIYLLPDAYRSETKDIGRYDYAVLEDVLGLTDDVEALLRYSASLIADDGRVVIIQYSALWEPILRLASLLRLRRTTKEQNWLSMSDLVNFSEIAGLEVVRSGTKMLLPKYIPLLSSFMNTIVANIFPFSRLGLFHYVVAKKLIRTSGNNNPSLSIIVPARNEKETVERIVRAMPNLGAFTEIIFIEGHSRDGTWDEIMRVSKKYPDKRIGFAQQKGIGKGDAVRMGFDMATGDMLLIYDADMTVPPEEVERFYRVLRDGRCDFVNGSRLVYPVQKGAMRVLNLIGNKFFSFALSAILGQRIKDTLCGTKVMWRSDYEWIQKGRNFFGDFDPFGDFDLLFGAAKLSLKILDMPVHYKERVYGDTNIERWKHGWLLLKMTIFAARKIRFR